ncbi:MAG: DUF1844 domain-containing protein [Phycisphaerales bacterium]|nr:DUF1844 domain-containing protein [Planctomycetota bacterium]MCH8509069.1 DUF1844 domain-containing protein [Phycisphaerales bacterium]
MADANQPKIIVDDDWKSAARAEKEKLAQTEAAKKPSDPAGDMPEKPSFEHLVSLLASQALMYLGQIPDQSGRGVIALDIAKMQIDLIGVIEEKTKGNLSEEENALLQGTLNEIRMIYVEVHEAVMKAQAEGKITAEQVSRGFSPGPMPG